MTIKTSVNTRIQIIELLMGGFGLLIISSVFLFASFIIAITVSAIFFIAVVVIGVTMLILIIGVLIEIIKEIRLKIRRVN